MVQIKAKTTPQPRTTLALFHWAHENEAATSEMGKIK